MNWSSKDVSGHFAGSDKIYLNNASVSLMPRQSIEDMRNFLTLYNEMGPDSAKSKEFVSAKLQDTRKLIAGIINCKPEEIVFTQSTTDGINFVARGLRFPANSNVIIRGGSHEHHANFYPWLRLQDKVKLDSIPIDDDGFFDLDVLKSLLKKETQLVALSHALYNTGAIIPVDKVGEMVDKNTCFFVDAAQTVGCTSLVDVSKMNCDFMSFNGSKWLCGPMGTGLFYCKRESSELLEPVTIGGESASHDKNGLAFKDMPEKFQTGFRNYVGVAGLKSSIKYLLDFGFDNIQKKNRYLANMLREELARTSKIVMYGPQDPDDRTSIVSFTIDGVEPDVAVNKLEKKGIILAVREISDRKIIRASPHFFNTEAEMSKVIDSIRYL